MRLILTFIFAFLIGFYNAQCDNGSNYYPSSAYTPTADVWGSATSINYAGEVIKINVTSGDTYQFSTCAVHGGVSASYDTQLTLRGPSGLVLVYSDDAIGCFTQSYIDWTATITGEVYLHLNLYNCKGNSTATEVRIYRTSPSSGSAEYVEVGDPNSTTMNGRVPSYGYYDYSWSAAIYAPNDLDNQPILIDKLSFDIANGATMTMHNQEIWLAHTPEITFPNGMMPEDGNGPWTDWKLVYNGSIDWKPDWNEIILDDAFAYDGNQSLIVKFINNHGSWASPYPEFRYTARTNTVVYNYKDGSFPGSMGYRNSYRPNTRFGNSSGNALPVVLISFNGEVIEEIETNVLLEWVVGSQINNDYFTIQRSTDLIEWKNIGEISGVGNTSTQLSYNFIDTNPIEGSSYYRLKQTDYDEKSEIFDPIAVTITPKEKVIDKIVNYMGQEVNKNYTGMVLEVYTDGTYVKKYYK